MVNYYHFIYLSWGNWIFHIFNLFRNVIDSCGPSWKKKNYSFSVDLSGGETGDLGDGGAPGEDGDHQEWGAPESQLRRGDMWVGEMYKEQ